jgi:pyridoxine 5-phosphate synthase
LFGLRAGCRPARVVRLSVNVNKVATLRNSRGGAVPDVLEAVRVCIAAGAPGITVHPRGDERHIRRSDVREIAALLRAEHPQVELNIEGDPRPDWLQLVHEIRPTQATLVPVKPGEITSQAGFDPSVDPGALPLQVQQLTAAGIRVSLFVEAEPAAIAWAARMGATRVELYTEPFARAYEAGPAAADSSFETFRSAAEQAHALGLGVNAGHDLELDNLRSFRRLPYLDEVSIGHALISRALFFGLERSVREYLECLRER